jgi:LDH2 family malate/lactate/ureidoglycolate dehydrogenase
MLMALNIPNFVPLEAFTADADELSEKIHGTPPADGFSEVLLPGEPEQRSRRQRLAAGIPVPETTWQDIQAMADELKLTL